MAPPDRISKRMNRINQRPLRFFFVGVIMGAGSVGKIGGSSIFSIGGVGAPGSGGMPGNGGSRGGAGSGSSRRGEVFFFVLIFFAFF